MSPQASGWFLKVVFDRVFSTQAVEASPRITCYPCMSWSAQHKVIYPIGVLEKQGAPHLWIEPSEGSGVSSGSASASKLKKSDD